MFEGLRYAWAKRGLRSGARKMASDAKKSNTVSQIHAFGRLGIGSHVMTDRLMGAILLGELALVEDTPAIAKLLRDETVDVAVEAAKALAKIGDMTVLAPLRDIKDDARVDVRVRLAATKAMTSLLKRVNAQL